MPLLCKNINVTTNKLESSPTRSSKSIHPHWYHSEASSAPELYARKPGHLKTLPLLEVNTWTLPEPAHFARLLKHSLQSFLCNLSKQHQLSCKVMTCMQSTRSSRLFNLWKSNMELVTGKRQLSEHLQGFKMLIATNAEGQECRLLCH